MLDHAKLVNIAIFLERVPVTGKEALAWSETYQAVQQEIAILSTPQPKTLPILEKSE